MSSTFNKNFETLSTLLSNDNTLTGPPTYISGGINRLPKRSQSHVVYTTGSAFQISVSPQPLPSEITANIPKGGK